MRQDQLAQAKASATPAERRPQAALRLFNGEARTDVLEA
jgi:hypothetical protein